MNNHQLISDTGQLLVRGSTTSRETGDGGVPLRRSSSCLVRRGSAGGRIRAAVTVEPKAQPSPDGSAMQKPKQSKSKQHGAN